MNYFQFFTTFQNSESFIYLFIIIIMIIIIFTVCLRLYKILYP